MTPHIPPGTRQEDELIGSKHTMCCLLVYDLLIHKRKTIFLKQMYIDGLFDGLR